LRFHFSHQLCRLDIGRWQIFKDLNSSFSPGISNEPPHGSDKSEIVIFTAGQHFKPKEPRRGRRNLSAARVPKFATIFKT
jgi:hypothetical protein